MQSNKERQPKEAAAVQNIGDFQVNKGIGKLLADPRTCELLQAAGAKAQEAADSWKADGPPAPGNMHLGG